MLRLILIVVLSTCIIGCGVEGDAKPESHSQTTGNASRSDRGVAEILEARSLLDGQQPDKALERLSHQIESDEPDPGALLLAIEAYAMLGDLCRAADVADRLASMTVPSADQYHIRAFELYLRCGSYNRAEKSLKDLLEKSQSHTTAHRLLAQLLNAQGRRREASEHVIELIRNRAVQANEILSLIDLSGPFNLVAYGSIIDRSRITLFDLGRARQAYAEKASPEQVIDLLSQIRQKFPDNPVAAALQGRVLAESGKLTELVPWLESLPGETERESEYWQAIGIWSAGQGKHRQAVRAFAESVQRDATNRQSLRSLIASLDQLETDSKSATLRERLGELDKVYRIARDADADGALWISEILQQHVRPWESLAWTMHEAQLSGNLSERVAVLDRNRAQVMAWERDATHEQIQLVRLRKVFGIDPDHWPSVDVASLMANDSKANVAQLPAPFRFADIARQSGLVSRYESGFPVDGGSFFPYQVNGGGLAIVDFDLDGRNDVYASQAGGKPNANDSTPNQLFRQLPDGNFESIAKESLSDDRGYGQGVCAGDVNQDGFLDLLVANVGPNVLFINQGDGTFVRVDNEDALSVPSWTSCLGLGDLNGDNLPDIVEVNYLAGPRAYQIACDRNYLDCQPKEFRKAADRVLTSDGVGGHVHWQGIIDDFDALPLDALPFDALPKPGFGLVIANLDRKLGNDVFIANDGDVNHFWLSVEASERQEDGYGLVEAGGLIGCGVGRLGDNQACMGVASGDFDRNGTIDLHVTNFINEAANLFLQNQSGQYSDESLRFGLAEDSFGVLGFGTQAADFDNDGWLDLVVSNGHVFDARDDGVAFAMPPQLFQGSRKGFRICDPNEVGPYWQSRHVGRAVSIADFDRDGSVDILINHLDGPTVLLENQTPSHNWIQLELVGTQSERDAIGASVKVHSDSESWTACVTGGDGHMSTNEAAIHLGIGDASLIDRIQVVWPTGETQEYRDLLPNQRYLLIEGQLEAVVR